MVGSQHSPSDHTFALTGTGGARATASLTAESWGTSVELKASGEQPGEVLTVSMRADDGSWWVAGTYRTANGGAVDVTMSCAVPVAEIDAVRVTNAGGQGSPGELQQLRRGPEHCAPPRPSRRSLQQNATLRRWNIRPLSPTVAAMLEERASDDRPGLAVGGPAVDLARGHNREPTRASTARSLLDRRTTAHRDTARQRARVPVLDGRRSSCGSSGRRASTRPAEAPSSPATSASPSAR